MRKNSTNLERTLFPGKDTSYSTSTLRKGLRNGSSAFQEAWYLGYLHDRCNFQAKLARVHQRIGKNSNARGKPQYEGIPFMTVVAHQSQLDTLLGLKENVFHGCGSIEPLYAEGGEYTRYTPDSNSWRNSDLRLKESPQAFTFPQTDYVQERVYREFVVLAITKHDELMKSVVPFFERHKEHLHPGFRKSWETFKSLLQMMTPKGGSLGKMSNVRPLLEGAQVDKFRKLTTHFNHRAEEVLLVGSCFAERAEMYRQRHLADEGIDFEKLERDLDNIFRDPQWQAKKKAAVEKESQSKETLEGEEKVQP